MRTITVVCIYNISYFEIISNIYYFLINIAAFLINSVILAYCQYFIAPWSYRIFLQQDLSGIICYFALVLSKTKPCH
jgi:hypothetical protein